jgi:1,4-dihydroxy-2-naphthoate octaprenyltransferase
MEHDDTMTSSNKTASRPSGLAKWARVTRAPFLTATLVPVAIGLVWSMQRGSVDWFLLPAVAVGAIALHVAANCFNDYFDWKSGADEINEDFVEGVTGGSRALQRDRGDPDTMYRTAAIASLVATGCGVALLVTRGWGIVAFGLVGLATAYFYTAPPLRLVARRGLGELVVGLNFGPLMVAGASFALTGTFRATDLVVGLPIGLLTTAILWVNEFPDADADAEVDKNHLVVTLGRSTARWGYVALLIAAFGTVAATVFTGVLPREALLFGLGLPLAFRAGHLVVSHDDEQLASACRTTIQLHLVAGLGLVGGLLWAAL